MRIKELREQAGWSQKVRGEKLGVAQNAVSNWERGTRSPDSKTLGKIADLFGVTVDYLLERTSVPIDASAHSAGRVYRAISRGARRLNDKQQQQLLDMARVLFREAFPEEEE
jgi:transcriptional regulator with XRE-family HTH domain